VFVLPLRLVCWLGYLFFFVLLDIFLGGGDQLTSFGKCTTSLYFVWKRLDGPWSKRLKWMISVSDVSQTTIVLVACVTYIISKECTPLQHSTTQHCTAQHKTQHNTAIGTSHGWHGLVTQEFHQRFQRPCSAGSTKYPSRSVSMRIYAGNGVNFGYCGSCGCSCVLRDVLRLFLWL